jgi:excisionase family DNA binding protein
MGELGKGISEQGQRTNEQISISELKVIIAECIKTSLAEAGIAAQTSRGDILSIIEASKFLNLAVTTIYEKTSKNLIPFFKRDKKLYFKKTELEEWLLKRKTMDQHSANQRLPIPKELKKTKKAFV